MGALQRVPRSRCSDTLRERPWGRNARRKGAPLQTRRVNAWSGRL